MSDIWLQLCYKLHTLQGLTLMFEVFREGLQLEQTCPAFFFTLVFL